MLCIKTGGGRKGERAWFPDPLRPCPLHLCRNPPWVSGNCAFPQNFHTGKSGEITVFFVVQTRDKIKVNGVNKKYENIALWFTLACYFGTATSYSPWTQDVNWMYIRRSKDVQDIFWTSYIRSTYVLCPIVIPARICNKSALICKKLGPICNKMSSPDL